MSNFEDIKQHLTNNFPLLTNVLQIELREEFVIIDYQGQSFIIINIISDTEFTINFNGVESIFSGFDINKVFKISNAKIVGFIPIDGKKGLLGFGNSDCDFIFFDNNYFCFVEFKLNATSIRKVNKNRIDAVKQLQNTINLFDSKLNKNYQGLQLEAYVCTPEFYPRLNASWQALAADFLEEYGIPLFEGNDKMM